MTGPPRPLAKRVTAARRIGLCKAEKARKTTGPRGGRPREPTSFYEARRRKELALARLRELEVALKEGSSLDAGAVGRRWGDVLRRVRAGVMAVPSRVRARLPHLTAADVEVIDRELRDALTALADADAG